MAENYNLKGGCTCGKVKYTITKKPLFTQACHCKDCKISTGSSYVIHTTVLENTLIVVGEVSSTELPTGSGAGYRAFFCNKCGVYLYCKYNIGKGRLNIRTKTLDDPGMFPPQVHIFTKDKDPWLNLSENQNCFETAYDRDKTWPEESIKRYNEYLKTIK
jgi:hypothetical protein